MGNHDKDYTYLEQLSTTQLKELLRADLDTPGASNPELVFQILEVIKGRDENSERLPNVDQAWEEFQTYYNIPEGDGLSLYPCSPAVDDMEKAENPEGHAVKPPRLRRALRPTGIAAIVTVLVFGFLISAQAAGFDILGTLGHWTEDIFGFASAPDTVEGAINLDYYNTLQATLDELGIEEDLIPTWYPEGFELAGPAIIDTTLENRIVWVFTRETDFFYIYISSFQSNSMADSVDFEKNNTNVEVYESKSNKVYIFSNENHTAVTWTINSIMETITGDLSVDEAKAIIDSIGG